MSCGRVYQTTKNSLSATEPNPVATNTLRRHKGERMSAKEALERASSALTDLAFALIPEEQRAEKAEQRVRELTNEIKRLKESEDAEMTRLKEIIMGRRDRVEELAEENRLLKRSADAAHLAGRELKNKVQEQEKQIEELLQKASEWEGKYHEAVDHSREHGEEIVGMAEEYKQLEDHYKQLEDKLAEVSPREAIAEHERRTQENEEQGPGTPTVEKDAEIQRLRAAEAEAEAARRRAKNIPIHGNKYIRSARRGGKDPAGSFWTDDEDIVTNPGECRYGVGRGLNRTDYCPTSKLVKVFPKAWKYKKEYICQCRQ